MRFERDYVFEDWNRAIQTPSARPPTGCDETRRRMGCVPIRKSCIAARQRGRDGTRLAGCVKQYAGELRLVYSGDIDADGQPFLRCLAVGLGHRERDDRRPDAYRIAHRRRHGDG